MSARLTLRAAPPPKSLKDLPGPVFAERRGQSASCIRALDPLEPLSPEGSPDSSGVLLQLRDALARQAVALCEDVELDAVRHAELVVDAAQMVAQRVLADVQVLRELLVVRAGLRGERAHHVVLALGERSELAPRRVGRRIAAAARQLDEDAPGSGAVEPQLAFVHFRDRLEKDLGRFFLAHYAAGTAQDRGLVQQAVVHAAEEQHARVVPIDEGRNMRRATAAQQLS